MFPSLHFRSLDLFFNASFFVQLIMILLVIASIYSWAIIIEKIIILRRYKRQIYLFEKDFWGGHSLALLYKKLTLTYPSGMAAIFVAAMAEWRKSMGKEVYTELGVERRINRAVDIALNRESTYLDKRLGMLATIGSAAPFVGLLGTVIGILISFNSIASAQETNIAIVAPGIAEALLATAIGLAVAIPAVVAYNRLQDKANKLIAELENFAEEFLTILSRQLDEKAHVRPQSYAIASVKNADYEAGEMLGVKISPEVDDV